MDYYQESDHFKQIFVVCKVTKHIWVVAANLSQGRP